MFASNHVQTATHWWCSENAVDPSVMRLIPFLFETLDALYATVLRFPESWTSDTPTHIRSGATHSMYIGISLPPEGLSLLRAAIGLSGDAFCIAKRLSLTDLASINDPLSKLLAELERLREVRNFFSHLDDRLAKLDKHGITGSVHTNCGIEYDGATGCFHLVLLGNVLYFVSKGSALEANVGKKSFLDLLVSARPTFTELVSHNVHREDCHYPTAEQIYAI
jgi:hypothetical protein